MALALTIFIIAVALCVAGYIYRQQVKSAVITVGNDATAFGKLAAADGKILALRIATEAKAAEAAAAHAAIDEVHKLLG